MTVNLDALFAPFNRSDAPGCTVAVARHGKLIYRGAFGMADVEHGMANGVATRMQVGSVSKQFVCAALLQLADEGALSLDDAIGRWVEGLSGEQALPSLRQLMSHTGGVRCYLDQWVFNGYVTMPTGMAERIQRRQARLNFAPGQGSSYSNGGYLLLSLAIERAAGMPLGQFLQARFFQPLGMTNSQLPRQRWPLIPGVATGYLPHGEGWRHGIAISDDLFGDGGLISTPEDMLRWAHFLRTSEGPVSLATLAVMTPLAKGFESAYGFGLITETWRGMRLVQHAGGMPGASSSFVMLPDEGLDLMVAFNRSGPAISMGLKLIEALLPERLAPEAAGPGAAGHAALLGQHVCRESGFMFGFADMQGQLGLSLFGGAPFPLDPAAPLDGSLPFVADVGTGGMRFRVRNEALEYLDGGRWRATCPLGHERPSPEEFSAKALGRFHSEAAAASLQIELEEGQLRVRFQGEYGGASYPAETLAPDLLRFWPTAFPGGMLARLEDDTVVVSTSRTCGTVFRYVDGGRR